MSKNILIVLSVIAIVVIIGWLMSDDEALVVAPKSTAVRSAPVVKSIPVDPIHKSREQKSKTENDAPELDDTSENLLADENFKAQIVNIAYQYSQTAQYPIGSQPITNPDSVRDPKPFEETETTTPFSTENGTVDLSAATDKFQYFDGETIKLQLKLAGAVGDSFISPEARIINPADRNKAPIPISLSSTQGSNAQFLGAFDTSSLSDDTFSPEMLIEITVNVDNEPLFTTLSFRYNEASAKLVNIGDVRPNGPNLDIPLNFDVSQKGYYFVTAVLQDQRTNKPLIALQQEGKMRKGRDQLVLQAHIQALKAGGSEGPYVIRSFNIYRGAEQGEQFDTSGASNEEQYVFSGFPFSQYVDEPHQDSLAQERAEFLLNLGALDSGQ
jgi:hypothetical protein